MARSRGRTGHAWRTTRARVIAESDGTCTWCGEQVDRTLPGTHPRGPTVDHTIELSDGGPETDRANLTLMHRACNEAKQVQKTQQRRLNASTSW